MRPGQKALSIKSNHLLADLFNKFRVFSKVCAPIFSLSIDYVGIQYDDSFTFSTIKVFQSKYF